jgi:hypothetical protein
MNDNAHTTRKTLQVLALAAAAAAIAVPAALAGGGLVPERLGSPDPHEGQGNVLSAGMVASKLGSQDPRDTAASIIAQLAPHRVKSRVARDASYDGDYMFRDFFRGTHYVAQRR